jgi:PAS domain S-box-containing protein
MQDASDVITVLEADGTIRYVDPAVEQMLGYRSEELIGASAFDYVHPEDLEPVSRSFAGTLKTSGVLPPIQFRLKAADGSWRPVEVVRNNRLDDPAIRGVVAGLRDVTERMQAEEQIRFQARLLDAVGQAVIAIDLQGDVVYWNRGAEELYGWSEQEAMGRPVTELVVSEDLRERAVEIRAELRAGKSWSGEFVVRRKDGTSFPALVTETSGGIWWASSASPRT